MRMLDAEETAAALPWGALVEALLQMFERERRGEAHASPRTSVALAAGGVMLLMPAADLQFAALKTVTVHAANAARGLPVVQCNVTLMDATTGTRLLAMDGNVLTARRTAALSLAGAIRAGRTGAARMLLIGAGVQARAHAEAFAQVWGIRRLEIHARTQAHAEELARHMRSLDVDASAAVADPAVAAKEADLIVAATSSQDPVVPPQVRPDATVIAVGAYRADTAEVPPELVRRSAVFVDTLEGARGEAGDLIRAGVDWSAVQAFCNASPAREGRPVLVKTVGHALWDLAAAQLAYANRQH
ncbi:MULTISPECIES: delta(1)-pyrroline-2-carboxylate reductase family protein [unclassified Variovorax]|jgi:ornithine cyclodeaminase/alanine dehydrogenase-like protein (mu-crystallin family)|uniref:delta(1)-pyrroline-2-carboxylate reductase family protein n=1 Tax=unclassified Variovorax TaxID=663243 RepID=UPI00198215AD|nr:MULTISPECIES: delta(1)-pyrroline-2-carboxylate reductase family protein [unclassified Variovorax]